MAPEASWRADGPNFQEPNFLKIDSTEIFLDLIKDRSKIFSWDQKNQNFWKIKIFIENFRKIENPKNFRKIEKFQLKSFYKIFENFDFFDLEKIFLI